MGAVGDPSVPDHVSLWGLLLRLRQGLDLWANVRPARLLDGIPCPLAGRGPADVDMLFVRENTEGEYAGVGGRAHQGLAVRGRDRVERLHAERGRAGPVRLRPRGGAAGRADERDEVERLPLRLRPLGRGRRGGRREHPGVRYERVLVDALAARSYAIRQASTSSSPPTCSATSSRTSPPRSRVGWAWPRARISRPDSDAPGLFEPVHGSAPDIAGQGIANPAGAIWSAR